VNLGKRDENPARAVTPEDREGHGHVSRLAVDAVAAQVVTGLLSEMLAFVN
jgi:hypothetical protein